MQHDIAIISVIYSVHHNCNFVSLWHSLQSHVAYETFTEDMMACRGCSAASQLNSQLCIVYDCFFDSWKVCCGYLGDSQYHCGCLVSLAEVHGNHPHGSWMLSKQVIFVGILQFLRAHVLKAEVEAPSLEDPSGLS